jgi:hypothetical protein
MRFSTNISNIFPGRNSKPTKKGKGLSGEDLLQFGIVSILDICGIKHYSIPNGVNKTVFVRWLFKMTGLKAGVPDLHLPEPFTYDGTVYYSAYIEVKLPGKYATKHQREWHETLRACGHHVSVIKSLDDLFEWLSKYRADKYFFVRTKISVFLLQHPELKRFRGKP